jgi:hypothetical protein
MTEEKQQVTHIAHVKLTEAQVNQAMIDYIFRNEDVRELVGERKVTVIPKWQTSRWDDKDNLVYMDIVEVAAQDGEEDVEETQDEAEEA